MLRYPGPGATYAVLDEVGVVSYERFGVDLTGTTPADDDMVAAHEYANANGLKVQQRSGTVLWRGTTIPVKTDCDLSGLTVRLDASSGDALPSYDITPVFEIQRSVASVELDASGITELETTHAAELVKGSMRCTHEFFTDNPFTMIIVKTTNVDIIRNGTANYNSEDVVVTSRLGNLPVGFVKDVATNIASVVAYPREQSRLSFKSPRFLLDGVPSACGIAVERNQTDVSGVNMYEPGATPVDTVRQVVRWKNVWDLTIDGVHVEGQDPTNATGTYGFYGEYAVGIQMSNVWGFGGWGIMGTTWCKKMHLDRCVLNRIDGHWACYDVSSDHCTIANTGIKMSGGGYNNHRNMTWVLTDYGTANASDEYYARLWQPREDYGGDFDGSVTFDGLDIYVGAALTASEAATIQIVWLGVDLAYDPGRDVSDPQSITVRDVSLYLPPGVATQANPHNCTCVYLGHVQQTVARKVYWPSDILVENVRVVDPTSTQYCYINAVTSFDYGRDDSVYARRVADTADRHGTNVNVIVRNVIPNFPVSYLAIDTGGLIRMVSTTTDFITHYTDDNDAWLPRISVSDCPHAVIDFVARGVLMVSTSCVHRIDVQRPGAMDLITRVFNSDIKPIDRNIADGAVAFDVARFPTGNVAYVGCTFYIPLDNIGDDFVTAIDLTGARGVGNYLRDGAVAGTHYTNAPTGFFLA